MSALIPPPPAFPPPQIMVPAAYGGADGTTAAKGSYGPVIAMLAVLAVLAAAAVAVGRLCFGRRGLGQAGGGGGHDLEAWVERKCGTCVGAGMFSSTGPAAAAGVEEGDAAAAVQPPEGEEGTERGEGSGSGGAS
ncbi:uncharacterized protein LOC106866174 [Brachypodium distachyon]|uniref:Uncharacterized protein n=1 Tax=Brachypodium distachyon TaxID=15368 RepID=A0A2K2DGD3_BRADI|nr:uncharacterized protein LOC106866174 [Brachypodium distachyon]PNT73346.1 hypothetical protein BRADI_2g57334v3 [Brachypodium distachyon]PNT73347.1 hypothetical protein BRADI_2g57334v3 [Brachypodium distachyon]|eukprot:XP_014754413.1 uncharacterized protein LOC106866174 [Brachypodium distachyon]